MSNQSANSYKNVREKMFAIQMSHKGFLQTENSEKKKEGSNGSAYSYTPGSVITASIRNMMDELHLMIPFTITSVKYDTISYPIYKDIGGVMQRIDKTDVLFLINAEFYVEDVDTGERVGPFCIPGTSANSIDKGLAGAISNAERAFFLKEFHIPTRDKDDDADAHDCGQIPGIPNSMQSRYMNASMDKVAAGFTTPQPAYAPQAPMPQQPVYAQQPVQQAPIQNAQQSGNVDYQAAVTRLANFQPGTATFNKQMSEILTQLRLAGYDTTNPEFHTKLISDATLMRGN